MIGALNAIQILVLTILFRMSIPRNVMNIEAPILKLTNFDIFHADFLFELLFGFGETEPYN